MPQKRSHGLGCCLRLLSNRLGFQLDCRPLSSSTHHSCASYVPPSYLPKLQGRETLNTLPCKPKPQLEAVNLHALGPQHTPLNDHCKPFRRFLLITISPEPYNLNQKCVLPSTFFFIAHSLRTIKKQKSPPRRWKTSRVQSWTRPGAICFEIQG